MNQIWQRVVAEGTRVFEYLLRSLPPETLCALLGLGGRAVYALSARRRRIALENLRAVYGDRLDAKTRRRIARASFESFGRAMAEALLIDRLFVARDAALARVDRTGPGWPGLLENLERGGMIVTAHLGSWEASVPYLRHIGMRMFPVVRTLANPYLDAWITKTRSGPDGVIRKTGAFRQILSVVKQGGWVGYLGDQNAGRHGMFVPFFGIEASTFPIPGALVRRFRVPVYFGVCVRQPNIRFRIHMERVPDPPEDLDGDAAIQWVLEDIHRRLEDQIDAHPDQYTWLHRRWKTRPKDEGPNPLLPKYPHKRPRRAPVATVPRPENP